VTEGYEVEYARNKEGETCEIFNIEKMQAIWLSYILFALNNKIIKYRKTYTIILQCSHGGERKHNLDTKLQRFPISRTWLARLMETLEDTRDNGAWTPGWSFIKSYSDISQDSVVMSSPWNHSYKSEGIAILDDCVRLLTLNEVEDFQTSSNPGNWTTRYKRSCNMEGNTLKTFLDNSQR
jgi:hypothetical protein